MHAWSGEKQARRGARGRDEDVMGSPAVAAFIAHAVFWILMIFGCVVGELRVRGVTVFFAIWLAGRIGLPYIPYGAAMFSSFVAVLDIALVFTIFKGDVRLT
jgi:hypothetical protein